MNEEVIGENQLWTVSPIGPLFLLLLFLAAFSIPILLVANVGSLFRGAEVPTEETFLSDSVTVPGPGSYLRVSASPSLELKKGSDFLLTAWFKLRSLPAIGQRVLLFSKFETATPAREGYALAILREEDGVRFAVYWKDRAGRGGWLRFSEVQLRPQTWFMVALSYFDDRHLGLHIVLPNGAGERKVELLGGYEITESGLPRSDAALLIGGVRKSQFRGKVGPVGVFQGERLERSLPTLLKVLTVSPVDFPEEVSKSEVMLWSTDGRTDRSERRQSIALLRAEPDSTAVKGVQGKAEKKGDGPILNSKKESVPKESLSKKIGKGSSKPKSPSLDSTRNGKHSRT